MFRFPQKIVRVACALPNRVLLKSFSFKNVTRGIQSSSSGLPPRRSDPKFTFEKSKKARKKKKKRIDITQYSKRHVALKIAYVGLNYHGLASQPGIDTTIEYHLFKALNRTFLIDTDDPSTVNYSRCGRTDKGVSALGNVISIDLRSNLSEGLGVTPSEHPNKKPTGTEEYDYLKMLNATLPKDIRIVAWSPVPREFNSRFDCRRRTYKYLFFRDNLNIEDMKKAAIKYVGDHDFRNLCKIDVVSVTNFVRRIFAVDIERCTSQTTTGCDELYEITIVGTAFLWHQIRCMVAVLFMVGRGLESPEIIDFLLDVEKCPGKPMYEMASEVPLIFQQVEFPGVTFETDPEHEVRLIQDLHQQWRMKMMGACVFNSMLTSLTKNTEYDRCEEKGDQKFETLVGHQLRRARTQDAHTPLKERNVHDSVEEKKRKMSGSKRKRFEENERARALAAKKMKEEQSSMDTQDDMAK